MDAKTLRKIAQDLLELELNEDQPYLGSLDLYCVTRLLLLMATISEMAEKHGLDLNGDTLVSLAKGSYLAQYAFACDTHEDGIGQDFKELADHLRTKD